MRTALLAIALMACGNAYAQDGEHELFARNTIDIYYSNLTFAVGGIDDDISGNGYGARLRAGAGRPFLSAEYQHSKPDGDVLGTKVKAEVDNWRVGAGYRFVDEPQYSIWGRAEYINFDGKISAPSLALAAMDGEDGYGIHLGGATGALNFFFYGEIGYIKTDETDGYEFTVGATWQADPLGLFVEYRRTEVETDQLKIEEEFSDIRAGLRIRF